MEFYTIIKKSTIVLNDIQYSIFEWKILNIVTFINALIYHNDNLITFYFEINETIYNFKLNYVINKWILEFDETTSNFDETHYKILDMVDIINCEIDKLPHSRYPNQMFDMIEKQIEHTDFD